MGEVHDIESNLFRRPHEVLAVSGSLRAASFGTAILRAMSHEEFPDVTIAVKTLEDTPLYKEDLNCEPVLASKAEMRAEVRESDGVVLATPEYNHGIPGILKNALDQASRSAFASCFCNKPVLLITSAVGGTGGVRASYQLREMLVCMPAQVVPGREIFLAGVEDRVCNGAFTAADTLHVSTKGIDALRREILCGPAQWEGA